MPPKARITKEMIIDASCTIVRHYGIEALNARTLAKELHCSTQPVMYHFATIDALKKETYHQIDHFHTNYLMTISEDQDPLLAIGLNYIRFALKEPHYFKFLFQSGYADGHQLVDLLDQPDLLPLLSIIQEEADINEHQVKDLFLIIAMFVHGYASIIANNHLDYDENDVAAHLTKAFTGALAAAKMED